MNDEDRQYPNIGTDKLLTNVYKNRDCPGLVADFFFLHVQKKKKKKKNYSWRIFWQLVGKSET